MECYLHEIIHTVPGRSDQYVNDIIDLRVYSGAPPERQPGLGFWKTAGLAGPYPKVINLWYHPNVEEMAAAFTRQFGEAEQRDTYLENWWVNALRSRRGGFDRILVPVAYAPSISELRGRDDWGTAFLQEIISLPRAERDRFLDRQGEEFVPVAAAHGARLIGAYRLPMVDYEVLNLWAFADWPAFGAFQAARQTDPRLRAWFAYRDSVIEGLEEMALAPARPFPFRIENEPIREDSPAKIA
jgi:hypothetical protein